MLPGVLHGVTLTLPRGYLGFYFGITIFYGPKISAFLKLKLLGKINFHLEMLPGPTPVVVTCLPGPPSASNDAWNEIVEFADEEDFHF